MCPRGFLGHLLPSPARGTEYIIAPKLAEFKDQVWELAAKSCVVNYTRYTLQLLETVIAGPRETLKWSN